MAVLGQKWAKNAIKRTILPEKREKSDILALLRKKWLWDTCFPMQIWSSVSPLSAGAFARFAGKLRAASFVGSLASLARAALRAANQIDDKSSG